jgi:serine/threonine protein kinase
MHKDTGAVEPAEAAADTELGTDIGPYRLLKVLGRGGMGTVYLAEHRELATRAAVKVISTERAGDAVVIQRLRREAELAAKINSPAIAKVYSFGIHGTCPYLAMEYVEGQTLAAVLRDKKSLSISQAMPIIDDICCALKAVHALNVVHRDIKLSNIMLQNDRAKLLDFGIAGILTESMDLDQRLTRAGHIIGTPVYMAPEQCSGGRVDKRADVYSLACVIYEMISGSAIFAAESTMGFMLAHLNETPCMPSPLIPTDLLNVLKKALAKDPDQRFQTIEEFHCEITACNLTSFSASPIKQSHRKQGSRQFAWIVGLLLVLVLAKFAFEWRTKAIIMAEKHLSQPAYIRFLESSLKVSQQLHDQQSTEVILERLSNQYDRPQRALILLRLADALDDSDSSISYATTAFELAKRINDTTNIWDKNGLVIPAEAIKLANFRSQIIGAWLSHPKFEPQANTAIYNLLIAQVSYELDCDHSPAKAEYFLTLADKISKSVTTDRSRIYHLKALILMQAKRYDEALAYVEKNIAYSEPEGRVAMMYFTLDILGAKGDDAGLFKESKRCVEECDAYIKGTPAIDQTPASLFKARYLLNVYSRCALIAHKNQDYDRARKTNLKALHYAQLAKPDEVDTLNLRIASEEALCASKANK